MSEAKLPFYAEQTFGELAHRAAALYGKREALIYEAERYTFQQVAAEVDRAAKAFMAAGIKQDDHVCIWLHNSSQWMFVFLGLARIGAVHVPINTRFGTRDLEYVLQQSDSCALITHTAAAGSDYLAMVNDVVDLPAEDVRVDDPKFPTLKQVIVLEGTEQAGVVSWPALLERGDAYSDAEVAAASAAVSVTDPVFIMYTSGTTGFPKGAVHTHNLLRNVEERGFRMAISPSDTILNYLPLFHAFGYSEGALMSLVTGARQIITQLFVPDECLDLIEQEKVSVIHGFEAHAKGLTEAQLERPRDISSLRTGLFASGMHSATPVIRRAIETLKPLQNIGGFGMTEVWLGVAIGTLGDTVEQRSESSGAPGIGYRNRIVDPETLALCAAGIPGEWQVQGEFLMQGYYKKPAETAASYTDDGWFRTGDMAEWREDGYIRFLGRYKDMLKVGGENVDPMEVEGLLLEHPAIHQVAVVGQRHDKMSEVPVAFVQLAPGARISAAEVTAYCTGKVAGFKVPRRVEFIDEFPMTASGKIRKVELRARLVEED